MKVVFVSSEISPFVKVGGLADVAGSLPFVLKKKGVDIIVLAPMFSLGDYDKLSFNNSDIVEPIDFAGKKRMSKWKSAIWKGLRIYFLQNQDYFERPYIYNPPEGDPEDMIERFAFFSLASLYLIKIIGFNPDVIHINDWHTAFIPLYLKLILKNIDFFDNSPKVLLTIHNLAFQGLGDFKTLENIGIKKNDIFVAKNRVNILRGAISFSDAINTVSPSYSKEILTREFGFGLEDILKSRSSALYGILNGIDKDDFSPQENILYSPYTKETVLEKKKINKESLLKEISLPVLDSPLFGMVSRVTHQKGFDFLIEVLDEILMRDLQLVILGTGEPKYELKLKEMSQRYDNLCFLNRFDLRMAKLLYAGSDLFLIPSRFEPCGLTQMIAMGYGTIPLVSSVGGLKDTVKDVRDGGWGFMFSEFSRSNFFETLDRAISVYQNFSLWSELVKKCIAQDFSWNRSADAYIEVYRKLTDAIS